MRALHRRFVNQNNIQYYKAKYIFIQDVKSNKVRSVMDLILGKLQAFASCMGLYLKNYIHLVT